MGGTRAARLAHLKHRANPRADTDFIVALDGSVVHGGWQVQLAFVPDRLLLKADGFEAYLAAFDAESSAVVEALALGILDDIGNEIVPRWARVVVSAPRDGSAARMQKVIVEDRQPNWDNPSLLLHLPNP